MSDTDQANSVLFFLSNVNKQLLHSGEKIKLSSSNFFFCGHTKAY